MKLAETDKLIDELMQRFEHSVFAGMRLRQQTEEINEVMHKSGNSRTCQGLCNGLISKIQKYYEDKMEPSDGSW